MNRMATKEIPAICGLECLVCEEATDLFAAEGYPGQDLSSIDWNDLPINNYRLVAGLCPECSKNESLNLLKAKGIHSLSGDYSNWITFPFWREEDIDVD